MSKPPKKTSKSTVAKRASTPPQADFDVVLDLIDAARTRRRCRRQHHAHRALLEHRRVHQPQDRIGGLG